MTAVQIPPRLRRPTLGVLAKSRLSIDRITPDRFIVSVAMDPDWDDSFRRYGFVQILNMVGVGCVFGDSPNSTIYCGTDPGRGRAAPIWIVPSQVHCANAMCEWARVDGHLVPATNLKPFGEKPNKISFDMAWAAAYWLTLRGEIGEANRDQHDRVIGRQSLMARLGALHDPPLAAYVNLLRDRLLDAGIQPTLGPWPSGKKYAVALTHDVDLPELGSPLGTVVKHFLSEPTSIRRSYWRFREDLRERGWYDTCLAGPTARREWDFAKWQELESSRGLRSAFYFTVARRDQGCLLDPAYDLGRLRYRALIKCLEETGWEVGVHTGYETCNSPSSTHSQVDQFAAITGILPAGQRHHYLKLDSTEPLQTLRTAGQAGIAYDSSLGFNDCAGFRTGSHLPFEVFSDDQHGSRIIELPMTLADMHLHSTNARIAADLVRNHLTCVRKLGGFTVLNWHIGHWDDIPSWRNAYIAACDFLAADDGAWIATPRQITEWWAQRQNSLFA